MTQLSVDLDVNLQSVEALLMRADTGFSAGAWSLFLAGTMGPYLQQRAKHRFQNEGDDVVGKWIPLTEATQAIRASQGYGAAHPINVRTHEMENYVTGSFGDALPLGPVAQLTFPDSTTLGGELAEKVKTAQQGKAKPKTPPRPVLGLNERDLVFLIAEMALYAKKVIG